MDSPRVEQSMQRAEQQKRRGFRINKFVPWTSSRDEKIMIITIITIKNVV